MADRCRPSAHDRRKLLDVATQPRHQPKQVIWPRVLLVAGLSVCFAPLERRRLPLYGRSRCAGPPSAWLRGLLRNEGGSVGTSFAQTFQERRDQFHTLRLGEYLDPLNAAASNFLARAQSVLRVQQNGDPVASHQPLAVLQLENFASAAWASSLAYFDTFWMASVLTFAVAFAVLLMKRSVGRESQSRRFWNDSAALARAMTRRPGWRDAFAALAGIE